jgi:hypothetical protein
MKSVSDPETLASLIERLERLTPGSERRWGTLTPHEMLCHLGDATALVLGERPADPPVIDRRRPVIKWIALSVPLPWPRGYPTRRSLDPKLDGTKPSDFQADHARAVKGLERVASAGPASLTPVHGVFGSMTLSDWHRWAYRHTHHHLRQFGL